MAAALIPFLPALAGALLGGIPSIVQMARGKGIRYRRMRLGGRMVTVRRHKAKHILRHRVKHPKYNIYRSKRHMGRGAVADALSNIPLLGMIAGPIARAFGAGVYPYHRSLMIPSLAHHKFHGRGVSTKVKRPYHTGGLLHAAGGKVRHRVKGHYRRTGRGVVRVKRHVKGGYIRIAY